MIFLFCREALSTKLGNGVQSFVLLFLHQNASYPYCTRIHMDFGRKQGKHWPGYQKLLQLFERTLIVRSPFPHVTLFGLHSQTFCYCSIISNELPKISRETQKLPYFMHVRWRFQKQVLSSLYQNEPTHGLNRQLRLLLPRLKPY